MKLSHLFSRLTFVCASVALALGSSATADDVPAIAPGSWTLAVLPDTQGYSQDYPDTFTDQTQWIVDHKVSQNIQFVLHEGDIVNDNNFIQWGNAKTSLDILTDNNIPTALTLGNHDYNAGGLTRDTEFNLPGNFGPGSAYATQSSIGGFFEAGRTDNSYQTFSAGGEDWLILSLEFGPRDQVVDWAKTIVEANPDRKAILLTHAYLYNDSSRYDWATKGTSQFGNPHDTPAADLPGGVNDGEELWDKLVSPYDNFEFVFAGHSIGDGIGYLASAGDNGNVVHQMLANYQTLEQGGQGYLRLLEFGAGGDTVEVRTYSPVLGEFDESPDQQFTLNRGLPPVAIANYEFTGGDFNNPDLVSTDTDPDTTASDFAAGPGFASLSSGTGDPPRSFFGFQAIATDEAAAIAAGHYLTFTITPGGDPLDLDSFTFDFQRDDFTDGVQSYTLRTDAGDDNFDTQLLAGTIIGDAGGVGDFFAQSEDLSEISLLQGLTSVTTLRLYLIGSGSTPADPNYRIDNVQLYGAVAVPEPSSLAMLLIGSVGTLMFRRRKGITLCMEIPSIPGEEKNA